MTNVEEFGASQTATPAENKAAFEVAIAAGPVWIPPKTYPCDQICVTTKPVIRGDGQDSVILSNSPVSAIRFDVSTTFSGTDLADFTVKPGSVCGTRGIEFVLHPGGYLSDFRLGGLFIWAFSEHGLLFDNSGGHSDGFFTGLIERGWCMNGIKGVNIGDRLTFSRLVVSGQGVAIDLSGVPGARLVVIEGCTLVTRGGGVALANMGHCVLRENNIEHPAYLGHYNGTLQTMVSLYNCFACRVLNNHITTLHGSPGPSGPNIGANYDVVIQGASTGNLVDCNVFGPTASAARWANVSGPSNIFGPYNVNE